MFACTYMIIMSVTLLVGNSCAGKSTLCLVLKNEFGVRSYVLDRCVLVLNNASSLKDYYLRMGEEGFSRATYKAIIHIEKTYPTANLVLDVGSGALQWPGSTMLFRKFELIHVTCETKDFYKRHKARGISAEDITLAYNYTLFSHKQELFNQAKLTVNTSCLTPRASAEMVKNHIESCAPVSRGF